MSTVNSSVQGLVLSPKLPVFTSTFVAQCRNQTSYGLSMVIGGTAAACNNLGLPGSGAFQRVDVGIAGSAEPLAPGRYPIAFQGTSGVVGAGLTAVVFDGTSTRSWRANSGTLTIDAVDGDSVSGSFEASGIVETTTNPAGDPLQGTVTGSFSGTGCHTPAEVCL